MENFAIRLETDDPLSNSYFVGQDINLMMFPNQIEYEHV